MLLTKTIVVKWANATKKHYIEKGYIFTKMNDEFEVRVSDLKDGCHLYVDVKCDCEDCKNPSLKPIKWSNYKNKVDENGKYYCHNCVMKLYARNNIREGRLKTGTSFKKWCIDNNHQDVLDRWDYDLNELKPDEVLYGSNGVDKKGYWFKCLEHPEHGSELKNINSFTRGKKGSIFCNKCNSFAQYLINLYGENALELYWDYERNNNININPWEIAHANSSEKDKVWIKCQEKDYHDSYLINCNSFSGGGHRCSYCGNREVHPLDSLGYLYPQVFKIWSNKNIKSPYEYTPNSGQKVWWKCTDGKHKDYFRSISESNDANFKCHKCTIANRRGENHPCWNGGVSNLSEYLRDSISQWKKDSIELCGYKCIISNIRFKTIHHLFGFNLILKEVIDETKLPIYTEINKYSEEELNLLNNTCLELHIKHGLGICMCDALHKLFHSLYGKGNNTKEQFKGFINRLENSEFDEFLKENNLELNINHEVLEQLI